ncbi:MAG: type II toxin-antitoxin system VapC family toxin [Dehalococcoidia bacterium]|nr:type II toxin-antitoxin system VapC family toxin [Dehalococcoidia bacterium]
MKLIDANVFVYALGEQHEYREACQRLIADVRAGRLAATIDVELLQELLHIYHRIGRTRFAHDIVLDICGMFPEPLMVTRGTMLAAVSVLAVHPNLESRDAVHAAVVLENGLEGIISADRGFDRIESITRFDPLEMGKSC